MSLIFFIDEKITFFLKNLFPNSFFFNQLFSFFSLKGNSIFIWILLIFIVLIFEERKNPGVSQKDKKFLIIFFLSFLITSFLTEVLLKNFFQRPRPYFAQFNLKAFQSIILNCPKNFSFPSSHAATAFAASKVLAFFDKKRNWFYYFTATTIAYSRIFLGCHYFLDVFFGAILGYNISNFILLSLSYVKQRRKTK